MRPTLSPSCTRYSRLTRPQRTKGQLFGKLRFFIVSLLDEQDICIYDRIIQT